jgi:hypothetical protein
VVDGLLVVGLLDGLLVVAVPEPAPGGGFRRRTRDALRVRGAGEGEREDERAMEERRAMLPSRWRMKMKTEVDDERAARRVRVCGGRPAREPFTRVIFAASDEPPVALSELPYRALPRTRRGLSRVPTRASRVLRGRARDCVASEAAASRGSSASRGSFRVLVDVFRSRSARGFVPSAFLRARGFRSARRRPARAARTRASTWRSRSARRGRPRRRWRSWRSSPPRSSRS